MRASISLVLVLAASTGLAQEDGDALLRSLTDAAPALALTRVEIALAPALELGQVSAIVPDAAGNLIVLHRNTEIDPVVVVTPAGEVLRSFGRGHFTRPHSVRLDADGRRFFDRIQEASRQMSQLIDDVLHLSKVSRAELRQQEVDLSALATAILERLREAEPGRVVETRIRPGVVVSGDGQLLRIALSNLLENAWKFTVRQPAARIEFGMISLAGESTYFVRDNGAGFDMTYADRLFGPFQRLHLATEFPGSGIGLATVRRIIHRMGGRVWAEGLVGRGATFHFTLERTQAGKGPS
jgi:signal transduction histidine kinase